MQLKQADINFLTNHCIQTLRMPFSDHREAIRNWVIQIYKVHDINLSAHRGGHFMDVEALQDADDLLNPVLLQEIERLFPYSSEAYDLRLQAITEERPLSELVFH
jgi:hypothetical protein